MSDPRLRRCSAPKIRAGRARRVGTRGDTSGGPPEDGGREAEAWSKARQYCAVMCHAGGVWHMGLLNKGFEIAGATPGAVQGWTVSIVSSAQFLPDFSGGGGTPTPAESFETGWGNDAYGFALGPATCGSFNTGLQTSPYEGFEVEWGNQGYQFYLGATLGATFGPNNAPAEGFETGWSNDSYLFELGPNDATAPSFQGSGDAETFETGWSNDAYQTSLGAVTDASFHGSPVEDFENVVGDKPFVAQASPLNLFLCADHHLENGTPVQVVGPGLPSGAAPGITYFIANATTNDFRLSSSPGGTRWSC
jgi:hypothetical protein